jgi:hypothetical protein
MAGFELKIAVVAFHRSVCTNKIIITLFIDMLTENMSCRTAIFGRMRLYFPAMGSFIGNIPLLLQINQMRDGPLELSMVKCIEILQF